MSKANDPLDNGQKTTRDLSAKTVSGPVEGSEAMGTPPPALGRDSDTPADNSAAATLTIRGVPAGDKLSPDRVNVPGFEVIEELGRGGMGVVYKARQLKLNRVVALKMILAGQHAGDDELKRFLGEAESVAALQDPHIVQVYESGQHGGLPFMALEFVGGGSLRNKLKGKPLPPREAARVVEQVARGIQSAHKIDIVHRDLKPGNVLLTSDGIPKITDFGLAKHQEGDASGLTHTGTILGTPSYMAPEQARGDSKHVGPAADIYALGALLYECLTGRPPFQGPTPVDTVMQVVSNDPVPPTQLQPTTPRDLETICLKCLRKEPSHRYGSAAEVADDLQRFLSDRPILARPSHALDVFIAVLETGNNARNFLGLRATGLDWSTGPLPASSHPSRKKATITVQLD